MPTLTLLHDREPSDFLRTQVQCAYPDVAITSRLDEAGYQVSATSVERPAAQVADILQLFLDLETVSALPANQVKECAFVAMLDRLNAVRAPYLLRYLLHSKAGLDADRFAAYRGSLQGPGMVLQHGHTQLHRYRAIEPWLPGGPVLIDIGCGRAYYLRRLAPRYQKAWGQEADLPTRQEGSRQLRGHGIVGVPIHGAFECHGTLPAGAHVLLTEVLEHVPLATARLWLDHLARQPVARLVLTVPNRDFNPHYGLTDGIRHPGHLWEPSLAEFTALAQRHLGTGWQITIQSIGDQVEGIAAGTLCVADRCNPPPPTNPRLQRRFAADTTWDNRAVRG